MHNANEQAAGRETLPPVEHVWVRQHYADARCFVQNERAIPQLLTLPVVSPPLLEEQRSPPCDIARDQKNALPTDYVAVSKVTGYNAQEYPYGHDNHYGCYSSHEAAVSLSPTLLILNSRQLRLCSSSMHDAHDTALSTAAVKKSALPFPAICFFQNERAYRLLLSCRGWLHACQQHHHQNA